MFHQSCAYLMAAGTLSAGTVVISSLPDESHPLAPLTTLSGMPLTIGATIRIGAFPGMADDEVLDTAAAGGLAALLEDFVPFGDSHTIGDGAEEQPGRFEIAVKQVLRDGPLVGEAVTIVIQQDDEFMVARFAGQAFEAVPDTGIEGLLSLHLADAAVIVGNRYGSDRIAVSGAPDSGSFESWIASFATITDPALRLPDADADGDGRSNFLEYATGGDPASPTDPPPCQIVAGEAGTAWIHFSRAPGIGSITHRLETSPDLVSPWQEIAGGAEPVPGSTLWMRVPAPAGERQFFRLDVRSDVE